jgi:hypothetical protein
MTGYLVCKVKRDAYDAVIRSGKVALIEAGVFASKDEAAQHIESLKKLEGDESLFTIIPVY